MFNFDFKNFNEYPHFKRNLTKSASFVISGLTSFLRLILLPEIKNLSNTKLLFITDSEQKALKYQNDLKNLYGIDAEILPYQNISFYEGVSHNLYEYEKQLEILLKKPEIVIAPVKSLLEKFPNKKYLDKNSLTFKVGDEISPEEIAQKLVKLGYKRSTMVSDISEFSIRGDIIDIFSLGENPLRIELWGDEIVDLRLFNNETQKSIEKIKTYSVKPIYKFIINEQAKESLPKDFVVSNSDYFEGIEVFQNYFNPDLVSIFDYLKEYIIVFDEMSEVISKYKFIEENYNKQAEENFKNSEEKIDIEKIKNHFTVDDFTRQTEIFQRIGLNNFIDYDYDDLIELDSQSAIFSGIDNIFDYLNNKKDYKIIVATDYPKRVEELFKEREIFDFELMESISCSGCILNDFKVILLTDRELFNKRSKEITATKRSYYKEKPEYIESINDIQEGDYVVHTIHGDGIYKGLTKQEIDGQEKDYLTIEYANNDKLHIPAEQINLLCRYRGSGTLKPHISRMGGNDWTNTKTKVKKEVEKIAYDLLRLYAKRKLEVGISFDADTPWQVEMEDAFEYVETPDQMQAIIDVKSDMEKPVPMDRLICGDVGVGKSEVAMRAIFKAVSSGKQVAVIVPTTILSRQHYQTMAERYKPFGVKVGLLSRFRTAKEQKETLKELALGECEVVVATHRLLQKDVQFKNLGLLVIDEEHRFGVRHKEKLKELKANIDIISMSATPIPRTLYMSISGIKDMSVINTPPKNRLPIKTFVGEFNEKALKNAITHELDRDGQVFYLYNRVETIEEFKMYLKKILPGVRIGVGHAKLDEKALEQVMIDFANKEYDILLCTTIIESGLDIPNANTIIVQDSDRFGLAQLYQLRGRVGRCERQAYCYCFYKGGKSLTKEALQRLQAIKDFTTLGSGYQVALRDIEIRGVGNLLGTKQHGHMVNVGFDTYCQLLDDAVKELQGEHVEITTPTIVDINVTAYIPDEWVGYGEQKMIEYKRLADVKTTVELEYITEEWKDRFSTPPEPVENLIKLIRIRLAATDAKISLIRETPDNIRIYTPYLQAEWAIIYKTLPKTITRYIKFSVAPKSCKEALSVLLLNNRYVNFDEMFNIFSDLFYH